MPYRDRPPELQPPPRQVPWSVRLHVLFGGTLSQWGWGLIGLAGLVVALFGTAALGMAFFALFGLSNVVMVMRRGVRAVGLVRRGHVTDGEMVHRKETTRGRPGQPIVRFTFRFRTADGRWETVTAETLHPHTLDDGKRKQVLYLKQRPEVATLVAHLAGTPRVNIDGTLRPVRWSRVALVTVLPALATIATLAAAVRVGHVFAG